MRTTKEDLEEARGRGAKKISLKKVGALNRAKWKDGMEAIAEEKG